MNAHTPYYPKINYLDWIKRHAPIPSENLSWSLALSGMPDPNPDLFKELVRDLPVIGMNHSGWLPLKEIIAHRYNTQIENVLTIYGTSQANFISISAILNSEDAVLIETPVYEPLASISSSVTKNIHYLVRRFENQWKFDLDELKKKLHQIRPRVFILTNPHNPTGVYFTQNEMQEICRLTQKTNTLLFVDEVYRDAVPDIESKSAFELSDHVIVTTSLTKCYGLGALRAGWMVAPSQIIQSAEYVHDRLSARNPLIQEELTNRILRDNSVLYQCGKERWGRLNQNRAVLEKVIQKNQWETILPSTSLVVFCRIPYLPWNEIYQKTINAGVLLTAGEYFGDDYRFRIALTADPEKFAIDCNQIELALSAD